MTRNGKIARLPRHIREELNRRLADGEMGRHLLTWLNSLPEVKKVLAADFKSSPINDQNLSDWKSGGFEEWLKYQEARAWAQQLVEESDDIEAVSGSVSLADRAALPVLLALDDLVRQIATTADADVQRETVLRVAQQLTQLRKATHEAERLRLEKDRWAMKREEMRRANIIQSRIWKDLDFSDPPQTKTPVNV